MKIATDLYIAGYVDASNGLPVNRLCQFSQAYLAGHCDGLADSGDGRPDLELSAECAATILKGGR